MVRNVLLEIYESKEITEVLKKVKNPDDIRQHVFLTLLEKKEEDIEDLITRGKLKAYIVKMIYNTQSHHRTKYQKEMGFNVHTVEFTQEHETPGEAEDFEFENKIVKAVEGLDLFKNKMIKAYAKYGTMRAVSEATLIPLPTVHRVIKQAREKIKQII